MDAIEYVPRVLEAYRATPGTCGAVRKLDRAFALQLHARGVPLAVVRSVDDAGGPSTAGDATEHDAPDAEATQPESGPEPASGISSPETRP